MAADHMQRSRVVCEPEGPTASDRLYREGASAIGGSFLGTAVGGAIGSGIVVGAVLGGLFGLGVAAAVRRAVSHARV